MNYLQPVFQFPDAPGGRLSIYLAGSTDLAEVFDPVSGAVISNPVFIDTAGYAAPFHVDADKTYDLSVRDFGGATVLTVNNVSVASGGGGGAGVPGPQGPRGPIGLTGATGKDGTNGKDGIDGADGADGEDGAPGVGLYRIVVDPESTTGRILYSYTDKPDEWHDAGSIMPGGQGMVKTGPSDSLGYLEQKIQAGPGVAVETDGQKITLSSTYSDDHKSQVHPVSTVYGYLSELFQAGVGVQISMDAAYNKMVISATGSAVGGWQWGGNWDAVKAYNLNTAVWYLDNTQATPINRLYIATASNQGINPYADAGLGAGTVWSCMCAIDYLGDQFAKLDAEDTTSGYLADKLRAGNNVVFTRVDEASGSHYLVSTVAPYQVLVGTTAKEYNQLYGVLEFVGAGGTTTSWNGRAVQINGLALGTASTQAARGDQGLTAYNHSQATGNPHSTTAAQISCTATGDVAATTVQAAIAELASEKQPLIAAGTTSQFFRGDKSWQDLASAIRATVLTGLAAGTNVAIVATDNILGAFAKVQAQITALLTTLTSHTGSNSNPHGVTKAQVGLGNVDNTSDAGKPVSTATQSALDAKSPLNTTLTDNAGSSTLPGTASGTLVSKIQALRDNVKYILANWLQLGETSATAYRGDRGKTAYDHSQLTASNPHGTTAAQIAFTPVGGVATTNVQAAIAELDMEKAYNVHSHVISDVTGLQSALDSVVQFNRGYATSSGYWWNCMVFSVSRASGSYDEQGGVFSFVSFGGMSADTAKTCKIIIELKNQSGTVTHSVKMVDSSNDMPIRVLYYSSSDGNNYLHIIPYVSVYSSVTVYAHQNDGYFAKNPSGMVGSSYTYELMGVPSTTVITDSYTLPAGAPIGKSVFVDNTLNNGSISIACNSGESIGVTGNSSPTTSASVGAYVGKWFVKTSATKWVAT